MKMKTWFSKVVAVLCAITVIASAIGVPMAAEATDTTSSQGIYQFASVDNMSDNVDGVLNYNGGIINKRLNQNGKITTMDGTTFAALINFAAGSSFTIGNIAQNYNFRIVPTTTDGEESLRIFFRDKAGNAEADVTVKASEIAGFEDGYLGKDMRVAVFMRILKKYDSGNIDIQAIVKLGSTYTKTLTAYDTISTSFLEDAGGIIIGLNGQLTLNAIQEADVYQFASVDNMSDNVNGVLNYNGGIINKRLNQNGKITTMDGTTFAAVINFSAGSTLTIGNIAQNYNFRIVPTTTGGEESLRIMFRDKAGNAEADVTVKASEIAGFEDGYLGKDMYVAVFMQILKKYDSGNIDIQATVKLGSTYTKTIIARDTISTSFLEDTGGIIIGLNGQLTLKTVKEEADDNQQGGNVPLPGYKDDSEFTVLDVSDFIGANELVVANAEEPTKRPSSVAQEGTLDGIMIDGIYKFEGGTINIGARASGLQLNLVEKQGVKYLRYQLVGANKAVDVSAAEINNSVNATDLHIKIGFTLSNVNTETATADVDVQVSIGDTYKNVYKATNYPTARLNRYFIVDARGASNKLTIKSANPAPEFKDESEFTVLDVSDFIGANELVVANAEEPAKRPSSVAQEGTLDGIMIDGIYKFEGGTINIGARASGLQLNLVEKQGVKYLRYQLVGANKAVDVSAAEINSSVNATDLHIKIGFTLSNVNTETATADVDVQVSIGDTYKNVYKATNYPTARLNRYFIVDARGASNKLTIKSANPAPEFKDESEFTVLDMYDFIGQEELVVTGKEEPAKRPSSIAQAGTLDGIMIDGIYKFEGGTINIGARASGLQLNLVEKQGVKYLRYQLVGANKAVDVSDTDANCDIAGEDVRIKVGFTFSNVNEQAGTADVAVQIHIGEVYKNIYTATNYPIARLNRFFVVDARPDGGSNSLTLKTANPAPVYKDDSEYTVVKVESFTRKATYEVGGEEVGMRPNTVDTVGTLDGLLIDGVYNFSGTPTLNMGGRQKGLQFQFVEIGGEKYLRYQLVGSGKVREVSVNDIGTQIYEQDLHIKVGFTFTESAALAGTYDVEMQVCIGDTYKDIYTVTGFGNVDVNLARILFVDARTAGSTLTIKAIELQEEPEPPFKDVSEYTLVAVQDFTGENVNKVEGTEVGMRPSGIDTVGSLDGLLIDGIYNFQGNTTLNMGGRQNGLQFNLVEKAGKKYLRYQLVGTGIAEDVSAEDIGVDIEGSDIRIKAGFTFTNVNEEAGTADVAIQIHIGDTYQDMYVIKGYAANSRLQRILYVDARAEGAAMTMKAVEKPEVPLPPVPQDSEYKKLTFEDYGIITDVTVEGIEAGYRAGAGTYDGYMVEGTFNFTGGSTVNFGGKYAGLQLNLIEKAGKTFLRYQLVGSGLATDVAASKVGCDLSGTDLKVVVGFTFANVDETAKTADVTVQIRIGDSYKNAFVAEDYSIEKLQRIIFVDARGEGNKVILRRPDMEPIVFEEFGFTKNYEVELGLKKK